MYLKRNCQYDSLTEPRSSMNFRTISAICPRSRKLKTGIASPLMYVSTACLPVDLPSHFAHVHIYILQELINFPKLRLPPHLKDALQNPHNGHTTFLPESTPNPSMLDQTSSNGNGLGNKVKLRIPIEKR